MMNVTVQMVVYCVILVLLAIPLGSYMGKVMNGEHVFLSGVLQPVERVIYRVLKIDPEEDMDWKKYSVCAGVFSVLSLFVLWAILCFQKFLPLNPEGIEGTSWHLGFNTAASFTTNTNWQAYSGESTLSYFSQMLGLNFQNFVSAAIGIAVLFALIRGFVRVKKTGIGNFYTDMTKTVLYILIPLSMVVSLTIASQGVPQTFKQYDEVQLLEPVVVENEDGTATEVTKAVVPLGPGASQIAIKQLGTNGGGFWGNNSAHPFENPTPLSNLFEMISRLLIPAGLCFTFGRNVKDTRQGTAIFLAMFIMLAAALAVVGYNEQAGTPQLAQDGAVYMGTEGQAGGNMEGKEVRFGVAQSALFTTVTTSFTTGTVNNMHDTLTPLGGMIPLLHMMLNVVFGGKGVGLMNMIMYAILAVFICGLMIGRTPEYLGKKIEGREMKLTALCIIIHPFLILFFSALAVSTSGGLEGITNPGFHGLSQVLYEYASSAANNGSGFEGLADNSYFWNITAGLAMFFGRYLSIVIQLAIAGSLMRKRFVNETVGTLRTDTLSFAVILVFVVYIFAALTFFPALALGPIAEHLTLWA